MGFIPEDYGQSTSHFSLIGTAVYGEVVLGHSFGAGVPSTVDGANAIMDSWEAMDVMAVMSNHWELSYVDLVIGTATGPISGTSTRTPLQGSVTATANAANLAILVRKTTDQGGRQGRGRLFLPGVAENDVNTSGLLEATPFATAQTVFGDMIDDFSTNDVPLRLLHTNPASTPAIITALSVQQLTATQRRRLRR